ncbi:DUF5134 domain-containing protein [Nocardia carnea]|uniref:DUF5134 domain-containing protein n=1 Tax=Nocardia carnea TaxID=37328 RepID=UPI0024548FF9|nr:DUF5134 domain-containing protein [Nocardia carnea]
MGDFVFGHAAVRVCVALLFLVAGALVLTRVAHRPVLAGERYPSTGCAGPAGDHEADAAHLLMCAVMLVMVLFPTVPHAHALHGVLLAMTLVFGLLLAGRIAGRDRARPGNTGPLGYHLVAAVVMLVTMSGHSTAEHGAAPGAVPVILALMFLADAVAVTVTARHGGRLWWAVHPAASGSAWPAGALPHVIMDLGMAYMLLPGALG